VTVTMADQRRWSYWLAVGVAVLAVAINLTSAIPVRVPQTIWSLGAALLAAGALWWLVGTEAKWRLREERRALDLELRQHALAAMRSGGGTIEFEAPIRH
jgi:hypothetical protein